VRAHRRFIDEHVDHHLRAEPLCEVDGAADRLPILIEPPGVDAHRVAKQQPLITHRTVTSSYLVDSHFL